MLHKINLQKVLLFVVFILAVFSVKSQISQGGTPPSFTYKLTDDYELLEFSPPDLSKIILEDTVREKNGEFYRIGVSVPINVGIKNSGTWTEIPDKGKIWRLMIKVENALALGVYFNEFEIPIGGKLFLYNYTKKQVIGAFTEINNHESKLFATELIDGDIVTLEYFEPIGVTSEALINISEVAYIYRGYKSIFNKDFGDADACLINVNCSEGANWQNQKRGVARILLKAGSSYGWCSGTLINNVRQDCTPYFLTADHCGTGASTSDFNQWIFYFNYESSSCSNPSTEPSYNTMSGATLKANGGNGGSTGSDFLLLKLNSSIPSNYNVYYNGWSNVNSATSSGVCIHHPMGDIKKISTYSTTPATSDWNNSNLPTHWQVTWAATTNGRSVTEGGSSGSPLFNSNGLVIGDLTGGSSYCQSPYNTYPDYFGKFSYSWASNGTTADKRLKDWLDPDNTGATTLQGKYCGSTPPPPPSNTCDTVSNIQAGEQLTMYGFQQQWGTWAGHGGYYDDKFADYHSGTTQNTKLHGLFLAVGKAYPATSSSKITVKVWGPGSVPGTELASKDVLINTLTPLQWNYVPFNSPVTVGNSFYVGFQIYYNTPSDTFAVYNVVNRQSGLNTAFTYENGAWHAWSEWNMYSSLGIYAVVCPTTTEIKEFNPENDIVLFPNPSKGQVYIEPYFQDNDNMLNVSVYNDLGILIMKKNYTKPLNGEPILLDLSNN
ncbi:MAG TPA: trypsin-like serine protease, partial [Bacteroidales bacterium]|nr:trypsin-like serine protease [Bacteroidales bacterium]